MTTSVPSRADLRRRQLAAAAYALLAEDGMEAVTAEGVARRAGLSRRTLFNYFTSAEDALTSGLTDWFVELTETLFSRPEDEPVTDSLRAATALRPEVELLEQLRTLVLAARTSPGARRFAAEYGVDRREALEDALRDRVGPDVDDVLVAFIARGLVAAGEAATDVWVDRVEGSVTAEAADLHHHLFVTAVELLLHGIEKPLGR